LTRRAAGTPDVRICWTPLLLKKKARNPGSKRAEKTSLPASERWTRMMPWNLIPGAVSSGSPRKL
jgi:hypothetical protein